MLITINSIGCFIESLYLFFYMIYATKSARVQVGYKNKKCGLHAVLIVILLDTMCRNLVPLCLFIDRLLCSSKIK
ncbi:hypothetical protein CXB51_021857 [Gossypium anomalum]|uniref:Uncharacterized protein n=1 Tax=Gossypium anomalum TaxID=47600 RepID=A0A8J5ZBP0_9ROSI|nr:hypothetical protein CXB51_021857 [Gossypium anomalum]